MTFRSFCTCATRLHCLPRRHPKRTTTFRHTSPSQGGVAFPPSKQNATPPCAAFPCACDPPSRPRRYCHLPSACLSAFSSFPSHYLHCHPGRSRPRDGAVAPSPACRVQSLLISHISYFIAAGGTQKPHASPAGRIWQSLTPDGRPKYIQTTNSKKRSAGEFDRPNPTGGTAAAARLPRPARGRGARGDEAASRGARGRRRGKGRGGDDAKPSPRRVATSRGGA